MEAYEVEDAQHVGDPRVTIRAIHAHKTKHGIDARTYMDTTKMSTIRPVKRSWVEHVRLRHPEASEVLDLVPHNDDWYTLPGDAASKSESVYRQKGKTAARAQRRAEHTIVETERKLMADYIDLCKQESNLLGDEAYYTSASQVAAKAVLVAQLIRTTRHNWTVEHKVPICLSLSFCPSPSLFLLSLTPSLPTPYTIGRGNCRPRAGINVRASPVLSNAAIALHGLEVA
jgi:hypothetical protein